MNEEAKALLARTDCGPVEFTRLKELIAQDTNICKTHEFFVFVQRYKDKLKIWNDSKGVPT